MANLLPGAEGVSPDLLRVIELANGYLPAGYGMRVGEHGGRRDEATQRQLVDAGRSKTMNSRHLSGSAIDLIPLINGSAALEDPAAYDALAGAMMRAGKELGVGLDWGGNWKSFVDKPHWQLTGGAAAMPMAPNPPEAGRTPMPALPTPPSASFPVQLAADTPLQTPSRPPTAEALPRLRRSTAPSGPGILSPIAQAFAAIRPFEAFRSA